MKGVGKFGQNGCGMMFVRSGEQCHVWLITNSGGDHADLFRRLSRAIDRLRIAASPRPFVIKVGEGLEGSPRARRFSHDQN